MLARLGRASNRSCAVALRGLRDESRNAAIGQIDLSKGMVG